MKPVADHKLESDRCLECNKVCNICAEVCPNRANLMIPVDKGLTNINQILHVDGMCNVCGNCGTFCPYSSEPYKVKLTLFWTEKDFMDSPNIGFYFLGDGTKGEFMLRLDGKITQVKFDQSGNTDVPIDDQTSAFIWTVYKDYDYLYKVLN